ncbi:hypothetical protein O2W14_15990 [Modestobacter sp. VKM Ac-2986]|uniref:hypothetical protein n=1 Tax=Modestobacter sp. VKM Ac-2986 TaxID=3004140 RepID=UPI0022AB709F|nr:hypothetical protein [Modestobacter sp. VKM Ac-2986]MCZ2830338.1 hypothetical protein [Modestobacter sp. VKM Ac-2986]
MTYTQGPWTPPTDPYQPAPPRRRSRWLTIGLPIGLLVFVCLGVAVWFGVRAFLGSLGPAQQAAEDYATALVDGRWDDAQGQLCGGDRSVVTADALAQEHSSPDLTGYRLEGIEVVSSNGRTSGAARLVFETASGLDTTTVLPLEEDGDTWRPCP